MLSPATHVRTTLTAAFAGGAGGCAQTKTMMAIITLLSEAGRTRST